MSLDNLVRAHFRTVKRGLRNSPVAEDLPGHCEALGSTPSTGNKDRAHSLCTLRNKHFSGCFKSFNHCLTGSTVLQVLLSTEAGGAEGQAEVKSACSSRGSGLEPFSHAGWLIHL